MSQTLNWKIIPVHINGIASANRYFFKMNIILFLQARKNTYRARSKYFLEKAYEVKMGKFWQFCYRWELDLNVKINQTKWKYGTCSCPFFIKNFMCKHLIAISARLQLDGNFTNISKTNTFRTKNKSRCTKKSSKSSN